jgi:hypothetical protein
MKKKITEVAENIKIRLLTHRRKAVIIGLNTIVLANLWYTASVYVPTKGFFKWLNKTIFEIVWKKMRKSTEKQ